MAKNNATGIAVLDGASRMLEEAKSLDEIASVRDTAEAARAYARRLKMRLEAQNRAAILRLGRVVSSIGSHAVEKELDRARENNLMGKGVVSRVGGLLAWLCASSVLIYSHSLSFAGSLNGAEHVLCSLFDICYDYSGKWE